MTRKNSRTNRRLIGLAIFIAVLVVGGFVAYRVAVKTLKGQIEQVLGPHGEIGAIEVAAAGVEIRDLRIRGGGKDWPAEDQLRARRILVAPEWRDLLSAKIRLASIRIEGGYVSMLRTRDGRLRVLPALLESGGARADTGSTPEISIGSIELSDGALDFYDATVRQPPLRLRLDAVETRLTDIQLPSLKGRTGIAVNATLKGVHHDGKVELKGWAEIASKDSEITLQLRGVDLVALQPYLIKAAETGVKKGRLDLDVKSTVKTNLLKAPGSLTLNGLELASGNSFMGMPRNAVVALMKDKNEKINVRFVLEGNLADPKFSLNESFATRVGSSVAETLGVSIEGLAKGVGSASRGIGEAVGKLFGK